MLLFFLGYQIFFPTYKTNVIDHVGYQLGLHSNVYAVIIDAGSTGSRILGLHFYRSALGTNCFSVLRFKCWKNFSNSTNWIIFSDGSLKLHDDLFLTNKPGLSSFSENPREVRKVMANLFSFRVQYNLPIPVFRVRRKSLNWSIKLKILFLKMPGNSHLLLFEPLQDCDFSLRRKQKAYSMK